MMLRALRSSWTPTGKPSRIPTSRKLKTARSATWSRQQLQPLRAAGGSVSRSTPLAMAIINKYNQRLNVEDYIGMTPPAAKPASTA